MLYLLVFLISYFRKGQTFLSEQNQLLLQCFDLLNIVLVIIQSSQHVFSDILQFHLHPLEMSSISHHKLCLVSFNHLVHLFVKIVYINTQILLSLQHKILSCLFGSYLLPPSFSSVKSWRTRGSLMRCSGWVSIFDG